MSSSVTGPDETREKFPEFIGSYRILRILGEGGMGTVYEAAETGAVRRNVALKVVRSGFASREVRGRFETERQALALMDHPGIAKVLNAGETENGEPFFAMEVVKGLAIDDYCDTQRLSTKQRLELFVDVCKAVQHAHQKGVIHRDLKPSNVLVSEVDGKPQPKIIDFGIAKALGLRLSENSVSTMIGMPMGTAAYMSPEQAESSGADIDTRTDIYSLGVLLYELLIGTLPAEPTANGLHAFMYKLASGSADTPRPSVRFSELGDYQTGVAVARQTTPDNLKRDLSGDLDWIVMKALEPVRARRYETVSALATDIERFLTHEPILARPPSTAYRLGKFVRRNRTAVAAASVVFLAVIVGAILATAGMIRAVHAEAAAARDAAATQQVSDFLVGLFRIPNPGEKAGNQVTAHDLLDRGASSSLADLAQQPQLQGRMMQTIGTAYTALGLYTPAMTTLQRALAAEVKALGPDDPAVAETELSIGDAMTGHGDLQEAEGHYQRGLSILQKHLGQDDPLIGRSLAGLAALRWRQGKNAEAEALYKRAIAIDEKKLGPDDPVLARHLAGLGVVYWAQKRFVEAEPLMRRSLDIQQRRLGPEHPDLAAATNNLGGLYWSLGRFSDALPLYLRTQRIYERTLDPTHPNMASISNNLAETYWKLGRYSEAEPLFRRALSIKEARLAPGSPAIAVTLNGLAGLLRDQRRFGESEAMYKRALAIRVKGLPAGDSDIAETVSDYAQLLKSMGRATAADSLLKSYSVTH